MFLNPHDQRPFFGGTYFPKDARYGMPAFTELLERVADYFAENRGDVKAQAEQLAAILAQLEPASAAPAEALSAAPLAAARQAFNRQFDRDYGGFEGAPKFPHAAVLEWLLRHWRSTAHAAEPDIDALYLVSLTLKRMADGGIRDHLGGGFCRYSVDRYWQIPHFEKMLYDNGPLLACYAQAALATGEPEFHEVAARTAGWLLARLQAPEGGFYSSLDADSEGEEGKYYVWTPDEVRALLPDAQYAAASRYYGLDREPNFEGHWHLAKQADAGALAGELGVTQSELDERLEAARRTLLAARRKRVPPGLDDKRLTSWNALAIRGLAIASRALQEPAWADAARRATDFLRGELLVDGRLYASWKDGRARFPAYLDDHAFLLDALLELLQCEWRNEDLEFAVTLAELLLAHFEDREAGGFWFTADDHEQLMHRAKPLADEALPSGNGVAALALQRLGFLLGETRYLDAAARVLACAWPTLEKYPQGHVSLLAALAEYLEHPEIVVIRGAQPELDRWQDALGRLYAPSRLVFGIPAGAQGLQGALAERRPAESGTLAYRCTGSVCDLPLADLDELARKLSAGDPQ